MAKGDAAIEGGEEGGGKFFALDSRALDDVKLLSCLVRVRVLNL